MKRKGTVNKSQFFFMPTNEDIKRPYTRFEKGCQNTLTATLQTLMLELY